MARNGLSVPSIQNRPRLFPGLDFYFTAYHELVYDRPIGMAVGPIPWSSVVKWGEMHGMDVDDIAVLEHHIRAMENAVADLQAKREKKGKDTA